MKKFITLALAAVLSLGAYAAKPLINPGNLEKFDNYPSTANLVDKAQSANALLTQTIKKYDARYPKRARQNRYKKLAAIIDLTAEQFGNSDWTTYGMLKSVYDTANLWGWSTYVYYYGTIDRVDEAARNDYRNMLATAATLADEASSLGAAGAHLENFMGSIARLEASACDCECVKALSCFSRDAREVIVNNHSGFQAQPLNEVAKKLSELAKNYPLEVPDYIEPDDDSIGLAQGIVAEGRQVSEKMLTTIAEYERSVATFAASLPAEKKGALETCASAFLGSLCSLLEPTEF